MNRRTLLAGSATAFAAIAGGCTSASKDERDGVILTHVELGNASGEPQLFDVLVRHDGEIIHWSLHEVGVGAGEGQAGGQVIDIDAPAERGRVDVHVRVGDVWSSTDYDTDEYEGEHVIAVVTYGTMGDEFLRISRRVTDRTPSTEG